MRLVTDAGHLTDAIGAARREADRAFGDGTLYVERAIERARHIEVQILIDRHGSGVHLFERDCSLQRRHQKVIEEAPASDLSPEVRDRMTRAALDAAHAVGYVNAGTVEFLLQGEGATRAFLFPGDEHATAGRAPGHRSGHRHRHRPEPSCASPPASRCHSDRTTCGSTAMRSNAACTPRTPCDCCHSQAVCCGIANPPAKASAWTPASAKA